MRLKIPILAWFKLVEWTQKEDAILKAKYAAASKKELLELLPGKNIEQIYSRASRKLKLKRPAENWRHMSIVGTALTAGLAIYFFARMNLMLMAVVLVVGYLLNKEIDKKAYEPIEKK